ncbi:VOC family protein [Reinekea blandensis]|uniref:VOC domain-containing protein n=1 Tax=Reinekea blandensis MED297 TaxID=314283 RepID=A4BKA4_9GAMM|nr:VOC family protein [Reinekea blandensis]EAR07471.1 hypothetical protein MED297_05129 [Reinekea sp. MED297] [Reinekea blandensis MED297]
MESPSIMNHLSIGTNDVERALSFYDQVLGTLGASRQIDMPGIGAAFGKLYPEFWVQKPHNEGEAGVANGVHFAFNAESKAAVDAFYQAAMKAGAVSDGEPGPRPHYGAAYYGCFVYDPDGHKIEATFWDETLSEV